MLAFSIDYYGIFFRATQSVELFCTYTAKANSLKSFDYFEYLLTEIPQHADDKTTDFLARLLSWSDTLPKTLERRKKATKK